MDRDQDIRTLTTTFYYLNDLYDAADDKKIHLGSRMIVDQFNNKFARLLYDYCMAVCLGEARHAQRICDKRIAELKQFAMDRHTVYNNACYFSEHSIISSCVEVFSRNWGNGSFGGNAWKVITETTGRYGTIPARLFIDFVIDLEHNSGCIFNKPLYFSYVSHDSYKALLDYKRNENIWETPYRSPLSVYRKFKSIFDDAVTLGIIERIPDWIYFVDDMPFPKAVEYGFVNLTVIDNDFTDRHDRDLYYCHRCGKNVDSRDFCHDSDHCKDCCKYCQGQEDRRRRERPRERHIDPVKILTNIKDRPTCKHATTGNEPLKKVCLICHDFSEYERKTKKTCKNCEHQGQGENGKLYKEICYNCFLYSKFTRKAA